MSRSKFQSLRFKSLSISGITISLSISTSLNPIGSFFVRTYIRLWWSESWMKTTSNLEKFGTEKYLNIVDTSSIGVTSLDFYATFFKSRSITFTVYFSFSPSLLFMFRNILLSYFETLLFNDFWLLVRLFPHPSLLVSALGPSGRCYTIKALFRSAAIFMALPSIWIFW